MKSNSIFLFLSLLLLTTGACVQFDENNIQTEELVEMTFKATIEDNLTKTLIDGNVGDSHRNLLWQPGDAIALARRGNEGIYEFLNINTEDDATANFNGGIPYADYYYAAYPYNLVNYYNPWDYYFDIIVPSGQVYARNTFAAKMNPMVATAARNEVLKFKNLCGLLVVNLTGKEKVKTISLSAYDSNGQLAMLSGSFRVYPDENCDITPAVYAPSSIVMDCGAGVQLSESESTPFHFVLAPGSYSKISLVVTTTDGKVMMKESKNSLEIKRAEWVNAGSLKYVEAVSFDLSERGNSNCYIVSKSGLYSFDAMVMGNGEFGIVRDSGFHTADAKLSPVTAEILWQDRVSVISNVSIKDGRISFLATGIEGNAVIVARDENGTILWSWHIWVTDQPVDQEYINSYGNFTLQDRNLGAIRADRGNGDEWRDAKGTLYQWGRKDPFNINDNNRWIDRDWNKVSISYTIANPTLYVGCGYASGWEQDHNPNLWNISQKTIYDPCPVGYRVAVPEVWKEFTETKHVSSLLSGSYDHGWDIYYNGVSTTYYPATWNIDTNGDSHDCSDMEGSVWSASYAPDANAFVFRYNGYGSVYTMNHSINEGRPVRCMKDQDHVDISYPVVKITNMKDITSAGATLVASVTRPGISEVSERGFVWGKTSDLSDGTEVKCGTGAGEFTTTITGLDHSTRYYFKAYAVNGRGRSETKIQSFFTPYSGDAYDLSAKGTANCYIVPPVYTDYVFNCSVKGNSNESVGVPASAEVLWETRLNYQSISVGSVIESVELVGNFVKFRLPFDPLPGNALIAVKDANGTILWSWHIWVVDFDPDKTGSKLISGAKVMDRNLGALSVIPAENNANGMDYSAYGLYYQWGRKDPFAWDCNVVPTGAIKNFDYDSSYDSVEASVQYPTHCYDEVRWGDDTSLWNYKKTKYDPCPSGWKVTEGAVWEGMIDVNFENTADLYLTVSGSYSSPSLIIPYGGYYDSGTNNCRYAFNDWIRLWASDCQSCLYAHDTMLYKYSESVDCRLPVRCMKDEDISAGGNEGYTGSDYEW